LYEGFFSYNELLCIYEALEKFMKILDKEEFKKAAGTPLSKIETSHFTMGLHMSAFARQRIALVNFLVNISPPQGGALNSWFSAQTMKMRQH
jgi:hypothetical protein